MLIDYSQYSTFLFCPWLWYEKYVGQRAIRYTGQRSDPLCLGSLVHNALDNFTTHGKPFFDEECILDNTPTPDTVKLAELMVHGYLKKYPTERWPMERAEAPLQFPLNNNGVPSIYNDKGTPDNADHRALAKLDKFFYVPEDTSLDSGIEGYRLTLSRGWWAKEYKTKAYGRQRSEWIKEWQTKRQADFQMMALQHYLDSKSIDDRVQGVLVSVLEKPHEYIPKRKCAGCKETYELASYLPCEKGFSCPVCGVIQELSPYIPKVPKIPEYFQITVNRTAEQLAVARAEITEVAIKMARMREIGLSAEVPDRDNCVNNRHRRECEFHAPHTYGSAVADDARFVIVDATKYMGVVV